MTDSRPTPRPTPRRVTPRRWTALAGVAVAVGTSGPAHAAGIEGHLATGPETLWLAQAEGGEGGEAGRAAGAEGAAALLTGLGLIEGHLRAGVELYRAGLADQAATHMKHPEDEVYAGLAPRLAEVGSGGFVDELSALAAAVASDGAAEGVEAAFGAVLREIDEARGLARASEADEAQALVQIVRTAAEEHGIGVTGGAIVELHEYQDAWGFIQTARRLAAVMAAEDDAGERAFGEKALAALDAAAPALPGVSPEGAIAGAASALPVAAATIELAAYGLK